MPEDKFRLFSLKRTDRNEKKKILEDFFGETGEYSRYYNLIGTLYRIAEFALLFALTVFIAVSALGNLTGISYTNAEYIVRNFALELESNSNASTELIYNPDTDMGFALFDGGLAVCGNTGLSVFSETGTKTLYDSEDFVSPVVRASEKYALVFESGGTDYCIYNKFSRVYTGKTTFPITGASIADNGYYVIISKTEEYTSCASVYDSDFTLVNRFLTNAYIMSAVLDTEGNRFAMATLDITDDGRYTCELICVTVGNETADSKAVFEDVMPLSVSFGIEEIYLLCSDRLIVSGFDGDYLVWNFEDESPESFSVSGGYAYTVLKSDNGTDSRRFIAFSGDTIIRNLEFTSVYCKLSSYCDRAFILTEKGLAASVCGSAFIYADISEPFSEESSILALNESQVYICNKSCAYLCDVVLKYKN